jgi:glycosyltransferase involved in cell wall biosynthesis
VRVGVDGRSLVGSAGRGVARYTRTLLSALAAGFPDDEWVALVAAGRLEPEIAGVSVQRVPVPGRVLYGSSAVARRPRLDRLLGGVDVFWAPTPAPLSLSANVPFVLSLLDLSWELRPSDFTAYERLWHRLARPRALALRAGRVMALSDSVRAEALARWGLDPKRTVTAGACVAPPLSDGRPRPGAMPERYLLYVGALEPRKAPDVLARAFAAARADGLDAELVVAGEGRSAGLFAGSGVRLLGHVSDAELESLYASALAVVLPSRLEGLGLPPLEAALRGTPSIVTDLPVFAETLGDAALRVPVDDVDALSVALLALATDADLRARLAGDALRAAARFTPERAAADVHAVLVQAAR